MPQLRELLGEILHLETWKEIDKRFVAFRRRHKFVPKKNVMYHLYMAQQVWSVVVWGAAGKTKLPERTFHGFSARQT